MENKQNQKAGNNSQQIQAGVIVMNQGIDERRAREVFYEMFQVARKDFAIEAYEKMRERIDEFEKDLIPKMEKIDGALESFADPSFQVLLTSAHKTAAITTNKDDYSILSELLIHKVKKGNDRKSIAGISKAIEIVNEIPEESLLGLTVQYALDVIQPNSGIIREGLDALDNMFSKLIYYELPKDTDWMEQLDVLNAIRISDFGKFKKVEEYYSEKFNGYCCSGIKKNTENYTEACALLKSINISGILIENELNEEYVRLNIVNKEQIKDIRRVAIDIKTGKKGEIPLSINETEVLNKIFNMYEKEINQSIKEKFVSEIDKRPNLHKVKEWINNMQRSYRITSIGKVLAHANAQRCDSEFPSLD